MDIILAKINIEDSLKKLRKKYNVKFDDDEIKFYKKNLKNLYFSELVLQFFANAVGGYQDLDSVGKIPYIKLIIILKKVLSDMGFVYIQHLFTGNIPTKIKKRRITSKQLERIVNSSRYKRLMKQYSNISSSKDEDNFILSNIAILVNTPMTSVDYKMRNKLGDDIIIDTDLVADEFIRYVNLI